jgi:hypothetical protein
MHRHDHTAGPRGQGAVDHQQITVVNAITPHRFSTHAHQEGGKG